MVISHNLLAMNANRQLGMVTGDSAKNTEKLSSGYKINRAADDAAGLSISEKMRKQIRGLTRASENSQDGVSFVQIADGALAEVHDMLDRRLSLQFRRQTELILHQIVPQSRKKLISLQLKLIEYRKLLSSMRLRFLQKKDILQTRECYFRMF